jgi:hypothetical protein
VVLTVPTTGTESRRLGERAGLEHPKTLSDVDRVEPETLRLEHVMDAVVLRVPSRSRLPDR